MQHQKVVCVFVHYIKQLHNIDIEWYIHTQLWVDHFYIDMSLRETNIECEKCDVEVENQLFSFHVWDYYIYTQTHFS